MSNKRAYVVRVRSNRLRLRRLVLKCAQILSTFPNVLRIPRGILHPPRHISHSDPASHAIPHPTRNPASHAASRMPRRVPHPTRVPAYPTRDPACHAGSAGTRIPRVIPHPTRDITHPTRDPASHAASRIPRAILHPPRHPASHRDPAAHATLHPTQDPALGLIGGGPYGST